MISRMAPRTRGIDSARWAFGRRRWCLGVAALLGIGGCGQLLGVRRPERAVGGVPPFSSSVPRGELPRGWRPEVPRPDLPRTHYAVVERDGRRVLHAVADRSASGLRCDVDIDPQATPWLEWEWRADTIDVDATVAIDERDDAPTRVAVGFEGDVSTLPLREQLFRDLVQALTGYTPPFATLMYVWDGQARPESVFEYARSSRIRYLVVESGAAHAGRWLAYQRNVLDDYRRVFGGDPGRIGDIGVLTDSDDLQTHFEAWYGDLKFNAVPTAGA